jgi:TRAP-type C4-dicarboxylate transport system substrate-binding protein
MTNKIRWTIAHEPAELFIRTAEAFNKHLSTLTNGEWEVETILTKGKSSEKGLMASIKDGSIDLLQIPVGQVGLSLLDWPYLFRDHDHATAVLEGEIGKNLLKRLGKRGIKGLAFTYSGGFRIFVSDSEINSLSDLKQATISVPDNPVVIDTLSAMGFTLDPKETNEDGDWVEKFACEAAESTFTRYLSEFADKKNIVNSEHSLFLTAVIARAEWFDSLDEDLQAKIQQAAFMAAADERHWSNEDTSKILSQAKDLGVNVYTLTEEEQSELKSKMKGLDHRFPLHRNVIRAIQSA